MRGSVRRQRSHSSQWPRTSSVGYGGGVGSSSGDPLNKNPAVPCAHVNLILPNDVGWMFLVQYWVLFSPCMAQSTFWFSWFLISVVSPCEKKIAMMATMTPTMAAMAPMPCHKERPRIRWLSLLEELLRL